MSAEPYVITVTDNVDKGVAKELGKIAAAARSAFADVEALKAALKATGRGEFQATAREAKVLDAALEQLVNTNKQLTSALDRNTGAMDRVGKKSETAAKGVEKVGKAAKATSGTMAGLTTLAGRLGTALGVTFGVGSIINAVEAYDELRSTLDAVTKSQAEYDRVLASTDSLATKTGFGVERLGENYGILRQRLNRVNDAGKLAEGALSALAYAVQASGKSFKEQQSALDKFVQGFSSGKVQTEEFQNLLARFPLLAQGLTQSLGSDWAARLKAGLISTSDLMRALSKNTENFRKVAEAAPGSIAQSWAVLQASWASFINQTNEATSATRYLASAITLVANNLNTVVPILGTFIALWATGTLRYVPTLIGLTVQGIALLSRTLVLATASAWRLIAPLTAMAVANPFTLMVIGATALGFILGSLFFGFDRIKEALTSSFSAAKSFVGELLGIDVANADVLQLAAATGQTDTELNKGAGSAVELKDATKAVGTEGSKAMTDTGRSVQKLSGDLESATADAKALTAALNASAAAARSLASALKDANAAKGSSSSGKAFGGSFDAGRPNVPRFANGGSFQVGGQGGVDRNLVSFMASANERVTVETAAQQRRSDKQASTVSNTYNVNITIPGADADSFRRSQGQIASDLASAVFSGLR